MFKKFIFIVILSALVFSIAPLEAICDDHFDTSPVSHQCTSICHTSFNVVILSDSSFEAVYKESVFKITQDLSYQNPTIARLKRPPIYLS
ncbi:MAG: hypothetical protein H6754_06700 [Candidatus Omnitrophica bacterium]|nr:hypothetical protein [Candidatus Omnitrophota bacterium]